jgi:hypothetical protein
MSRGHSLDLRSLLLPGSLPPGHSLPNMDLWKILGREVSLTLATSRGMFRLTKEVGPSNTLLNCQCSDSFP